MEALYLLIPLSILIVFIALWVFFAASDGGQFDDLVGPGLRLLQDDDRATDATLDTSADTTAVASDGSGMTGNSAADSDRRLQRNSVSTEVT